MGKHGKKPPLAVLALIAKARQEQKLAEVRKSQLGQHLIIMMRAAASKKRREQGQ